MAQREEKKPQGSLTQQVTALSPSFLAQCWPRLQLLLWAPPPFICYSFQSCGLRGLGTEAGGVLFFFRKSTGIYKVKGLWSLALGGQE